MTIKLHTIFLLGYISPSLNQVDYEKLTSNWMEKDMNYLMDLFFALSSSSDLTVRCDNMRLSAEDIVSNMLNFICFTKKCLAVICQPKMIQPCILLLQKGTNSVKQLTCQLLWELLLKTDDVSFRDAVISESNLISEISVLSDHHMDENVVTLSGCLKTVLQQDKVDPGSYIHIMFGMIVCI